MSLAEHALAGLETVTIHMGELGEERAGQQEMCEAVAKALEQQQHLVVSAGTGTGKSLAYLLPLVLSEGTTVVATATKNLQDQLVSKDLPLLQEALDIPLSFSVLKGRSNYLCRQKVREHEEDPQLALQFEDPSDEALDALEEEIQQLTEWAEHTSTGDRDKLNFEPSEEAWQAVSVGVRECPGVQECPSGETCFAERARDRARDSNIVVVNTHLYCQHMANDHQVLPGHHTVVFDEAHQLEDVVAASLGVKITASRFRAFARRVGSLLTRDTYKQRLLVAAAALHAELEKLVDEPLPHPLPAELLEAAQRCRDRVQDATNALREQIPKNAPTRTRTRVARALKSAIALINDLDAASNPADDRVIWVEQGAKEPAWRMAPLNLGEFLDAALWQQVRTVLTSATIPTNLTEALGLAAHEHQVLNVGSPFNYKANGLLYCSPSLPRPNTEAYTSAVHAELEALINAAGGRTLALFTSYRAMRAAVETLRPKLEMTVHMQGDMPRAALLKAFADDTQSCLFATLSFWQGVDVPGESLSLVVIDRIPFPVPTDPLLAARKERHGRDGFRQVDLPRAAVLLAQGAGRLIRTATDQGVVAVLDSRLATGKSYRWALLEGLPPFRRTRHRAEAEALLRSLRDDS